MTSKLIFFLLIILLSACQNGNPENSNAKQKLDEQPTVSFSYNEEEIPSNDIKGCFVDDCSEDHAFVEEINHSEFSKDLEPTKVEDGDKINVEVNGQEPTQIYYSRNYNEGISSEDHTLKGNEIEINGEGTERYFMVFEWYNKNDEFLGALSKAFKIEIVD